MLRADFRGGYWVCCHAQQSTADAVDFSDRWGWPGDPLLAAELESGLVEVSSEARPLDATFQSRDGFSHAGHGYLALQLDRDPLSRPRVVVGDVPRLHRAGRLGIR